MEQVKKENAHRRLQGVVVSNRMQKTAVVKVDRVKMHPKYQKHFTVSKKYKAHDEKQEYIIGDHVVIEETRPISRDKRWRVVSKV